MHTPNSPERIAQLKAAGLPIDTPELLRHPAEPEQEPTTATTPTGPGAVKQYKQLFVPGYIDQSNVETAFLHSLGYDDRRQLLAPLFPSTAMLEAYAEQVTGTLTNCLTAANNYTAQIWVTTASNPQKPEALYFRIK